MGLFANYNKIMYPLTDENGKQKIYNMVDIMTRIKLIITEEDLLDLTDRYVISDHETPEFVSLRLYGTPDYYWTILFINEMYDYISDWHMNDDQLEKYCEGNYDNIDADHYIIDDFGIVVMNPDPDLLDFQESFTNVKRTNNLQTITAFAWENIQNESRREIRVIKPNRIVDFVRIYNEKLNVN